MKLRECKSNDERVQFLEKKLELSLKNIQKISIDSDATVHCENRIGSIAIPLGVAGPFQVRGEHTMGECYIPLATTEGALIASVNRGAKATFEKGISTTVEKVGVTRGPVLKVRTLGEAKKLERWIRENKNELEKKAQETSTHIHLINILVRSAGLYVYIRLSFDTDRAMGMNMATIASQHIIDFISEKMNCEIIAVAGNFDIDKKPAWINSILGRGYIVQAEAIISQETVHNILKTTSKKIEEVWKAKCLIGSALSGSIGFNAHHANCIAAFYCATGQDLAHVVEGSLGITLVEEGRGDSLYISVNLPCVMVGSIGGGTKLITQTEARSILKTDSPTAIAEIVGAAVLAGELSLLASLSEGTLASTHKKLGR